MDLDRRFKFRFGRTTSLVGLVISQKWIFWLTYKIQKKTQDHVINLGLLLVAFLPSKLTVLLSMSSANSSFANFFAYDTFESLGRGDEDGNRFVAFFVKTLSLGLTSLGSTSSASPGELSP